VKLRKQKGETKPNQKNHYCANGKIGFMELVNIGKFIKIKDFFRFLWAFIRKNERRNEGS
jgi:hypothetical protein